MTKKMKKKMEVFKLEERVLFDAAAAADIVEAMQNDPAAQNQQSEQDHRHLEQQHSCEDHHQDQGDEIADPDHRLHFRSGERE